MKLTTLLTALFAAAAGVAAEAPEAGHEIAAEKPEARGLTPVKPDEILPFENAGMKKGAPYPGLGALEEGGKGPPKRKLHKRPDGGRKKRPRGGRKLDKRPRGAKPKPGAGGVEADKERKLDGHGWDDWWHDDWWHDDWWWDDWWWSSKSAKSTKSTKSSKSSYDWWWDDWWHSAKSSKSHGDWWWDDWWWW